MSKGSGNAVTRYMVSRCVAQVTDNHVVYFPSFEVVIASTWLHDQHVGP